MGLISDEFYSQKKFHRDYNSGVELISIYRGGNAMSTTMLDITLHIDEETTHDEREDLRDAFLSKNGVMTADCRDERPHLMIVGYDPEDITAIELLATAQNRGYCAEMIAL